MQLPLMVQRSDGALIGLNVVNGNAIYRNQYPTMSFVNNKKTIGNYSKVGTF